MPFHYRDLPQRYLVVSALVILTAAIRWGLSRWTGSTLAFSLFAIPLMLSAFLFGPPAALLATFGGVLFEAAFAAVGELSGVSLFRGLVFLIVGFFIWRITHWLEASFAQVMQAERKAQQAHQYKDRFLAVLGHELRNPLNGISLGATMLMKQLPFESKSKDLAQLIGRQAKHMEKLLDDMLDISRIEQGKIQMARREVNLQETLQMCLDQQIAQLEIQGQTLKVHTPTEPVRVLGDRDRLIQIVANLLTNASKYSGRGSQIDMTLSVDATNAVLTIEDNGPGIPADQRELIFEPFIQLENAQAHGHGGLGLGLPTVKSLITLHGGSIAVSQASPEGGARFTIRLPRMRSTQDRE